MLNIKYNLFDEILWTSDVKYVLDDLTKKYIVASTIPHKWSLIVPECIQNTLCMRKNSALTYIVNGKCSSHHDTTDSNRARLKESMRGITSKQYAVMHDHVQKMIWLSATIETYAASKPYTNTEYDCKMIERYMFENEAYIQTTYDQLIEKLGESLHRKYGQIAEDKRMSSRMKEYIRICIDEEPQKALEVLFFMALFAENDSDKDFFTEFESHYLDNNQNEYRMEESQIEPTVTEMISRMVRPESSKKMHVHDLSVKLVYNDHKWWALVCLE